MNKKQPSVKQRLKDFLLQNIGVVVTSRQLADVAHPASEWARRVRELRNEEGWQILTHHDRANLKQGEYLLVESPPDNHEFKFQRSISQRVRAEVLDRDGSTCMMCGLTPEDTDPETGRPTRLHMGHIVDKSLGGSDDAGNLRTLCSTCNQGAKNVTTEKPSLLWLLSQMRRASNNDQREVYEWLQKKFGETNS